MQSLGLISFLLLFIGIVGMLTIWPADISKTFSQNAARQKSSIYYYAALLTIFLILLTGFIAGWLIPALGLGDIATSLLWTGVVAQLIAAYVPETEGKKKTVHIWVSAVMSACVLGLTVLIALNTSLALPGRIIAIIAAVIMAFCAISILSRYVRRYSLVVQATYFLAFFMAILSAGYLAK